VALDNSMDDWKYNIQGGVDHHWHVEKERVVVKEKPVIVEREKDPSVVIIEK
jgi:hypothetical protein